MANYGIQITDNSDGSFALTKIMRAPTTVTITGGTDITPPQSLGSPVGTTTGWPFMQLGEAIAAALEVAVADRAKNG